MTSYEDERAIESYKRRMERENEPVEVEEGPGTREIEEAMKLLNQATIALSEAAKRIKVSASATTIRRKDRLAWAMEELSKAAKEKWINKDGEEDEEAIK